MSSVAELLKRGELSGAMEAARREVEEKPGDGNARFVLFELLVLQEDFAGAREQLGLLSKNGAPLSGTLELFLGLLDAEESRRRFLQRGEGSVSFLLKPPAWAAAFVKGAARIGQGDLQQGSALLQQARQSAPTVTGWADSVPYKSIQDADDVLGPFLEALVPGRYCWIPFSQIESARFAEPRGFQEVIWRPAEIELREGPSGRFWIPSLYCGTGTRTDLEKLGRTTTFEYPVPGLARGYGQRDLKIDDNLLMGILNLSSLVVEHGQSASQAN